MTQMEHSFGRAKSRRVAAGSRLLYRAGVVESTGPTSALNGNSLSCPICPVPVTASLVTAQPARFNRSSHRSRPARNLDSTIVCTCRRMCRGARA